MYILILGYSECGEWVYEVEYCGDISEVEAVLETITNPTGGVRKPDSVELARQLDDAPTDNIMNLMNMLNGSGTDE